jgi:MFS family permease
MIPVRARQAAFVAFFVQGTCFAVLLTRVPALKDRFSLTDGALALVLLVVPVVAGAGSLLAGALAGRYGSAPVLRIAAVVVCAGLAGIGAAPTPPLLFAVLAVFALALGGVDATMNMQGVAIQRAYGRSVMSGFHAVFSLAGILGSLAAAAAAGADVPLAVFFGGVAVFGIAASALAGPWLLRTDADTGADTDADADADTDAGRDPGAPAAARIPRRPLLLIGAAVTCLYIADSATANWSAVYLADGLHSAESVAALAYGCYAGATLLGRLVTDTAVDRYGVVPVVRLGGLVAAAGLVVVVAAPSPLVAIAGFALLGLGLCAVAPQSFTAAARLDPTGSGAAVARVNVFNYLGFVLGAPLVGLVAEVSSLRLGFVVPLLLVLLIVATAKAFDPAPVRGTATPGLAAPAPDGLPTMKR